MSWQGIASDGMTSAFLSTPGDVHPKALQHKPLPCDTHAPHASIMSFQLTRLKAPHELRANYYRRASVSSSDAQVVRRSGRQTRGHRAPRLARVCGGHLAQSRKLLVQRLNSQRTFKEICSRRRDKHPCSGGSLGFEAHDFPGRLFQVLASQSVHELIRRL